MFVLWVIRFFVFTLYESPKYLMGRGHDEAAVEVVHKVAAYNGKTSYLTIELLKTAESGIKSQSEAADQEKIQRLNTTAVAAVQRKLSSYDTNHIKALFATRKLAWNTTLLIALWGNYCI